MTPAEAAAQEPVLQLAGCVEHFFHHNCLKRSLEHSMRCPVCLRPAGAMLGTQPAGTMSVSLTPGTLPGHSATRMMVVNYAFPR